MSPSCLFLRSFSQNSIEIFFRKRGIRDIHLRSYICSFIVACDNRDNVSRVLHEAKLQTNDACLHPDSPSASPPETVHHTNISSGKRDAFPRVFDSLATLPFRSLLPPEKKIGNFLKILWKMEEQRNVKFESVIFNSVKRSSK